MDGIPASVSAVIRTILTSALPRFAYSVSQMAAPIPSGTQMTSAISVISTVFTIAGVIETLVELYSQANSSGDRWGMPLMRMYPTISTSTPTEKAAPA